MKLSSLALVAALLLGMFAFGAHAGVSSLRLAPAIGERGAVPLSPFNGDAAAATRMMTPERKSTTRAVFYSLLLPGLGNHYVGDEGVARTFFAAELAVWSSFTVFQIQGHVREDGYHEFAQTFAGVAASGHSDDYYRLLSQYDSSEDYENEIKREGRFVLYPNEDVATLEQYFIDNRIADFEAWSWDNTDRRLAYQNRRSASKRSYRRALYTAAAGLANRAASAFFAVRSAKSYNSRLDQSGVGFRIEFGAPGPFATGEARTGVSLVGSF